MKKLDFKNIIENFILISMLVIAFIILDRFTDIFN